MAITYQKMETCLPCYRAGEGSNRHCKTCPCCSPCGPHQQVSCLKCFPMVTLDITSRKP